MKFLIIFISIILMNNSCNNSKVNQDLLNIEYSASSRGVYKQIIINKKTILTATKRGEEPISKKCNTNDWDRIIKSLKSINIENIPELEPPSKNHQFDGAAMARLKITSNEKTFESKPFDHGNPPKEIAALIKDILSLGENVE